jgi:hypothetical protein
MLITIRGAALKAASAGVGVASLAVQPASAVRRRAIDRLGQAAVAFVDGALASSYADQAVRHVLESELAERAVTRALSGRLVDVAAADLVRSGGVVERVGARLVEGPELDRMLAQALESAAVERVVADVVDSAVVRDAVARVADDAVERLRSSPALWNLINDVAQSPAIADAIAQQGAGFADQVGDELRDRSRSVDERLERAAARLLRRRSRHGATPSPTGAA